MEQNLSSQNKSFTFLPHVWALALLNGANIFGFIAYHQVQDDVLGLFNFTDLVIFLGVIKAIIGLIMNPLMGHIADKHRTLTNKAFNLVGIGVNFAGVIFITVAIGATASANPTIQAILRPIVPILVILWLVAMAVFNSPAMSLITAFAPPEKTMQVYISFAMIDILLVLLTPYIEHIVDALPLGVVFALGGAVLWGAYRLLRSLTPSIPPITETLQTPNLGGNLALIFVTGMLITFIVSLPLAAVPFFLTPVFAQMGITSMPIVMVVIFGISIALAIPLGNRLKKGSAKVLGMTMVACLLLPALIYFLPYPPVAIIAALGLSVCSTMLKLNSIPFVFTRVKSSNGGIGIGFYFAGVSLAVLVLFFALFAYDGKLDGLLGDWVMQ